MRSSISFVQIGLGPIGQQIIRYARERSGLSLAAAVDTDPEKAGRDAGLLSGGEALDLAVCSDLSAAIAGSSAELAVIATVSSAAEVEESILQCIENGKNVITSAEELSYPWAAHPEVSRRIDTAARANGVTVLATGVNPGLVMDTLPLVLSGACRTIENIHIQRHQDAALRRLPFQQKIGAGLTVKEFSARKAAGLIRHVGFAESIQMIALTLGWTLERVEEKISPVIAAAPVAGRDIQVDAGRAAGLRQVAKGYLKGKVVITLELEAYIGHPNPKELINITGEPSLTSEIKGGINGDVATCAMIVNAVPRVVAAAPGLMTMPEIPTLSWFDGLI